MLLLTIKEVGEKLGLSNDTLRYYEKVGLVGPIGKTKSGIRDYNENDVSRLEFIKCMREAEISINVLKKYLDLFDMGEDTKEERKNLLDNQRIFLENKIKKMEEAHQRLLYKLKLYQDNTLDELLDK